MILPRFPSEIPHRIPLETSTRITSGIPSTIHLTDLSRNSFTDFSWIFGNSSWYSFWDLFIDSSQFFAQGFVPGFFRGFFAEITSGTPSVIHLRDSSRYFSQECFQGFLQDFFQEFVSVFLSIVLKNFSWKERIGIFSLLPEITQRFPPGFFQGLLL